MAFATQTAQAAYVNYCPVTVPSRKVEAVFYAALLYSLTQGVWGISIPLLAGFPFLVLAGVCFMQLEGDAKAVYGSIAPLIACMAIFLLVQVAVHGVSIFDESLRPFIIWILQLVIVHALCLRPGFALRYPLALFLFGLAMVPFLTFDPGELARARVDIHMGIQGGLTHPGGIAEWFGFFAVYFTVRGFESTRLRVQIIAWLIAVGCLFTSLLGVSRSILFALAIAITVASRRLLRRGFVPILAVLVLTGFVVESGLFETAVSNYEERGMEKTGREILWPAAVERIVSSPGVFLFGEGEPNVGMRVLSSTKLTWPHNAFLHFWLSAGVLPVVLFSAFWIQAFWRSVRQQQKHPADPYRLPFLIFAFVDVMFGDTAFMAPWALLIVSLGAGSAVVQNQRRLIAVRVGDRIRLGLAHAQKRPLSVRPRQP